MPTVDGPGGIGGLWEGCISTGQRSVELVEIVVIIERNIKRYSDR